MSEHTNPRTHFGDDAEGDAPVDREELRAEVRATYAAVAERCRYDLAEVDALPSVAVESFVGVANPSELRTLEPGERVVDLGSGAGFDCVLAARSVRAVGWSGWT